MCSNELHPNYPGSVLQLHDQTVLVTSDIPDGHFKFPQAGQLNYPWKGRKEGKGDATLFRCKYMLDTNNASDFTAYPVLTAENWVSSLFQARIM